MTTQKAKAKPGLRVLVYSPDCKRYWGEGTITKVDSLIFENEVLSDSYPSEIRLENGLKTEGLKCRWIPIREVGLALVDKDNLGGFKP